MIELILLITGGSLLCVFALLVLSLEQEIASLIIRRRERRYSNRLARRPAPAEAELFDWRQEGVL